MEWSHNLHSYDGYQLLLSPEDESQLREMTRRLSQDPRNGGSTSAVLRGRLLDLAIQVLAGQQTANEALDELDQWLSLPAERRRVFIPVPVSITRTVSVGECTLHPRPRDAAASSLPTAIAEAYANEAVMEVVVNAKDQRAALLTAQLPVDEALGCLTLPRTAVRQQPIGSTMARQGERAFHSSSVSPTLMLWPSDVENGELIAPWSRLSQSLRTPTSERGDLERRLAGATRWFFRSIEAIHPEETMAHLFAALDTAFVEGDRDIGRQLARAVKQVIRIEGKSSPDEVGTWVGDLYEQRSKAVHRGKPVLIDDDVGILDSVTRSMLRGAVKVLDDGAVTLDDLNARVNHHV